MKVLIVEPGQYPRAEEIEDTLDAMQHVVGGCIEAAYPWSDDNAAIVCNDEGLINGMPLNRAIHQQMVIAGTFFVCGLGEEDFIGLTNEQLSLYEQLLHEPQLFLRTPDGMAVRACTPGQYRLVMGGCAPAAPQCEQER